MARLRTGPKESPGVLPGLVGQLPIHADATEHTERIQDVSLIELD